MSSPNSSLPNMQLQLRLQLQLRAFESQPADLTVCVPLSMRAIRYWHVGTADKPGVDVSS